MKSFAGAVAATVFVISLAVPSAHAAPTRQERASPELAVAGADAALVAFGEWLQQIQAAQAPMMEAFSRLSAQLQSPGTASTASLVAQANAARSLARTTVERVRAIRSPNIVALSLPAEVQPATLQREQLLVIAEMERVAQSLLTGIEAAGQGDRSGAEGAFRAMYGSIQAMLRQRILFARATLAVIPRRESSWDISYSEVLALRSAAQMLSLFLPGAARDERASRELTALADEFASTRRTAAAKIAAETARTNELSRQRLENMPSAARLLQRARSIDAIAPRYLDLMEEWERFNRDAARLVLDRSVSQQVLSTRLAPRFSALRQRNDQILAEMAAAMASN